MLLLLLLLVSEVRFGFHYPFSGLERMGGLERRRFNCHFTNFILGYNFPDSDLIGIFFVLFCFIVSQRKWPNLI